MTDESESSPGESRTGPERIRSLAVTTEDVVTALEANERRGRNAVLRATPPFAGRMRARLHLAGAEGGYDDDARPVHLPPERLVRDPPAFPTVDETGDELRASEEPYTRERHRERHAEAVEAWRRVVRGSLDGRATLETPAGPHEVDVNYLG